MTQSANHNQAHYDDCLFSVDHLYEAALGILEPDVRVRLEHHLAECDVCRAELAELDATVNLLPLSVEQTSPGPDVKSRLLDKMSSELASPPDKPLIAPESQTISSIQAPPTSKQRSSFWSYGSLIAGVCVALLAIGMWNVLPIGNNDDNAPQGQMRVLAMENSDCEECHENTRGHIGADLETNDGMVVAWNLDPGKKHEVWCVNKHGERIMVGELRVDETGGAMQSVSFPEAVGVYDQIYVARNDGTEELTVAPSKMKTNGDVEGTPPD